MTKIEREEKRREKLRTNEIVENAERKARRSYEKEINRIIRRNLRYCSAEVLETSEYFILCSYSTQIACIDKETKRGYDYLRLVYGYTATSAQHIAKFFSDYNAICTLRWVDV